MLKRIWRRWKRGGMSTSEILLHDIQAWVTSISSAVACFTESIADLGVSLHHTTKLTALLTPTRLTEDELEELRTGERILVREALDDPAPRCLPGWPNKSSFTPPEGARWPYRRVEIGNGLYVDTGIDFDALRENSHFEDGRRVIYRWPDPDDVERKVTEQLRNLMDPDYRPPASGKAVDEATVVLANAWKAAEDQEDPSP